jgi:hypothetical protein
MVEWEAGFDRLACITHVRFPASENLPVSGKPEVLEAADLLHPEGADRRRFVESMPLHRNEVRRRRCYSKPQLLRKGKPPTCGDEPFLSAA